MDYYRAPSVVERVEQRRILGEYYRDLATNFDAYHQLAKEIGPTLAWPSRPNVPEFENL